MATKKILVSQVRSSIRRGGRQLNTLKALGLGRIGRSAVHDANPSVLGMVRAVSHLVLVEQVDTSAKK